MTLTTWGPVLWIANSEQTLRSGEEVILVHLIDHRCQTALADGILKTKNNNN